MPIKRYLGQPLSIVVHFKSNPLTVYGKDYTDIVDATMNLKLNLATDLDNAYLEKKFSVGAGVTWDATTHKFSMNLLSTDYATVTVGTTYFLVLAVDVGESEYIELRLEDNLVEITQDENRS